MSGVFISLEGVEGVGKSTNLAFIGEWLKAREIPYVQTREPGGTPLAEDIRGLLLTPRSEAVDACAELLLVFAARAQHLHQHILPSLAQGQWVVSDRFTDATYAYQGAGRGLPVAVIAQLETIVQQGRQPDLTLYLDLDVQVGLERARQRGELDRFEQEEISFFERVRQGYLARLAADPQRFVKIDASQSLPAVQREIAASLETLLARQSAGSIVG